MSCLLTHIFDSTSRTSNMSAGTAGDTVRVSDTSKEHDSKPSVAGVVNLIKNWRLPQLPHGPKAKNEQDGEASGHPVSAAAATSAVLVLTGWRRSSSAYGQLMEPRCLWCVCSVECCYTERGCWHHHNPGQRPPGLSAGAPRPCTCGGVLPGQAP